MKSRPCFDCFLGLVMVLSSSASVQADLSSGLTAYWRLSESSGSIAHDSVGTYSATLNGDASFINDTSRGQVFMPGTPGIGNALVDGSNPVSTATSTVMAWAKLSDSDGFNFVFESVDYSLGSEPRLYVMAINGGFRIGLGTTSVYGTSANFDIGNWHQVALSWQENSPGSGDGSFTAYFDGAPVQATSYSGLTSLGNYFSIGSQHYPPNGVNGSSFRGLLDEAAVWNRALTDAEVLEAFNQGFILPPPVGTPGDFNSDDKVDAADYVLWRKNNGTDNALDNDNDLGTPIGPAHYDLWRTNFGNPPPGSGASVSTIASVPEPGAGCLMALAITALAGAHRVRSRASLQRVNGERNVRPQLVERGQQM